jgi:peptidoglycan/xylan/chitin deacetylase (PgdA/CDA1 family)
MGLVKSLALTFDDGPDAVWTPPLLDLLQSLQARATFFPIASRAVAHRALIGRMLGAGHSVQLHCDEHVRHSERDLGWLRRDTASALGRLAGLEVRPALWRTPWGEVTHDSRRVAGELGLRLVRWTVDTHDWRGDDAGEMFRSTLPGLRDGAIVLAHDGIGPGARRTDAAQTVRFTALVAGHAERYGFALEALA